MSAGSLTLRGDPRTKNFIIHSETRIKKRIREDVEKRRKWRKGKMRRFSSSGTGGSIK